MSVADAGAAKPAVLIVGGLGYIGRWLALYIHENKLASEVRLVDKVLPQLAFLADEFAEACSADKFMQADAGREQTLSKIFTPKIAPEYTYVFNCGGETRYSLDDSVYALRSTSLSLTLARECARRRIPSYVEFGTGIVYKPSSSSTISGGGCTETAPLKPWLKLARHKLDAEEGLEKIRTEVAADGSGELRYTVLRLPHVYGDYDIGFVARGLCLARVYRSKGDDMKWLYGQDLRVNTVHVLDAVRAAWLAAAWAATVPAGDVELEPSKGGRMFNVVDEGDTAQGDVAEIVAAIFEIKTGFQGSIISMMAKMNLETVVDDINDHVLQPWAELLAEKGIERPGPIGPFMEKELLKDCNLCLNADRAKRVLGWKVEEGREKINEAVVRSVVKSYERMGWWP